MAGKHPLRDSRPIDWTLVHQLQSRFSLSLAGQRGARRAAVSNGRRSSRQPAPVEAVAFAPDIALRTMPRWLIGRRPLVTRYGARLNEFLHRTRQREILGREGVEETRKVFDYRPLRAAQNWIAGWFRARIEGHDL